MQQVAVGAVDLDAVQAGGHGPLRRRDDVGEGGLSLLGGQRVRHRVGHLALRRVRLALDRDRRRRDDPVGAGDVGMRDPAAVHDLHDDAAATLVHGVGDAAPAGGLLVVHDAGLAGVGARLGAGVRALGDDQAHAGALPVVLDDEVARHARAPERIRVSGAMTTRLASWRSPRATGENRSTSGANARGRGDDSGTRASSRSRGPTGYWNVQALRPVVPSSTPSRRHSHGTDPRVRRHGYAAVTSWPRQRGGGTGDLDQPAAARPAHRRRAVRRGLPPTSHPGEGACGRRRRVVPWPRVVTWPAPCAGDRRPGRRR